MALTTDFFQRQALAHRNSKVAIALFVLATLLIVAAVDGIIATLAFNVETVGEEGVLLPTWSWLGTRWDQLGWLSLAVLGLVGSGSLFKVIELRKGGGAIARSLGGRLVDHDTENLKERRLMNVVAEMSIASGVPMPEVYILEEDMAINAFAAGYTPSDAAIGVTRGTVERLSRDELQGVIAHEFSHVLNGDMWLNIRMIGVLHGILMIALLGQIMLRSFGVASYHRRGWGGSSRRRSDNGAALILVGVAVMVVGYIGLFFARLIKAALSRQREYLADASAVQFTRNPRGIAGALKKIGGFVEGSRLQGGRAEEISHMLFGAQRSAFARWMATHPPLTDRIRSIEPGFDPAELEQIRAAGPVSEFEPVHEGLVAGLAGGETGEARIDVDPGAVVANAATPDATHLRYAAALLGRLPDAVRHAAQDRDGADALIYALLLGRGRDNRSRQVALMEARLDQTKVEQVAGLYKEVRALGEEFRLPLLDLAFPSLKNRTVPEIDAFLEHVDRLIHADDQVDLFEWVLSALLRSHFKDVADPSRANHATGRVSLSKRMDEVRRVLATVAHLGDEDGRSAAEAYETGMMALFGAQSFSMPEIEVDLDAFDEGLVALDALDYPAKKQLVRALLETVVHDGWVTIAEAEVLRAVCETLHVPIPPLATAPGAVA